MATVNLTPDQAALMTQLADKTVEAIADGITFPGQDPSSMPGISAYAKLSTQQKAVAVNELKRTFAGLLTETGVQKAPDLAPIPVTVFLNRFTEFGGTTYSNGHVTYQKDAFGVVTLGGLAKAPTVAPLVVLPAVIFTLPVGYRPSTSLIFGISANDAVGSIEVDINGNVIARAGNQVGWFSLSGVTFKAA